MGLRRDGPVLAIAPEVLTTQILALGSALWRVVALKTTNFNPYKAIEVIFARKRDLCKYQRPAEKQSLNSAKYKMHSFKHDTDTRPCESA